MDAPHRGHQDNYGHTERVVVLPIHDARDYQYDTALECTLSKARRSHNKQLFLVLVWYCCFQARQKAGPEVRGSPLSGGIILFYPAVSAFVFTFFHSYTAHLKTQPLKFSLP